MGCPEEEAGARAVVEGRLRRRGGGGDEHDSEGGNGGAHRSPLSGRPQRIWEKIPSQAMLGNNSHSESVCRYYVTRGAKSHATPPHANR